MSDLKAPTYEEVLIGVRSLLFFILALKRNTRFAGEMGSASSEE